MADMSIFEPEPLTLYIAAAEVPRADDEIFTFNGHDGTFYVFNASLLRRMYADGRAIGTPDTMRYLPENVDFIVKNHGIDTCKLNRLRSRPDLFMSPPLVADMPDGSSVVIDGNHRIVILASLGHHDIVTIRFQPSEWRKCLLDVPPEWAAIFG